MSCSPTGSSAIRPNSWVELDLDILAGNLAAMRAKLDAATEIIHVVKANAYGHGLVPVAMKAATCGVRWFLVARLDEALDLRAVLPQGEILLLGAVWPADLPVLAANRVIPILVGAEQARALAAQARQAGLILPCHIKVDTGMGRFGFAWETAPEALAALRREGGLSIRGLCMHYASAGRAGDPQASLQSERFKKVVEGCRARGMEGLFRHVSNSAAFATRPEMDFEGVRAGIMAYGYGSGRRGSRAVTHPFLQWKTRVVQVKRVPAGFPVSYLGTYVTPAETWLATIDAGYSDGFPRLMSNKGLVLVGGRRARVVGRVTMNFTVIDVGPQGGVQPGDEVVLVGTQGGEALWADELANWCQTIPYEILTNIRGQGRS